MNNIYEMLYRELCLLYLERRKECLEVMRLSVDLKASHNFTHKRSQTGHHIIQGIF